MKYFESNYEKEDEIFKRILKIRDDWYSVDFHPFELGASEEHEKWEACVKNMIDFLEELIKKA